jgi:RimJ/RimL family protein N-acetyltransferase
LGDYTVRAVQPEDTERIRQWRNAQMTVLRQGRLISEADQRAYYQEHIWPMMAQVHPANILLSFFHHGRHIGYGGLVHIAWPHARAEVSFLLDNELTADEAVYAGNFLIWLRLLKLLAFEDLLLNRLYTETWAFRETHMAVLEQAGFQREGVCREHVRIDGQWYDAVFHGVLRRDYV